MRFGEIYSKSWKEFKANKNSLLKIVLFFYAIPTFVLFLISFLWLNSAGVYQKIVGAMNDAVSSGAINSQALQKIILGIIANGGGPAYSTITLILSIVCALMMLLAVSCIISVLVKKEKFGFSEAFALGKKNYWILLGFMIVYVLSLLGLFILIIIPGIMFLIYWIFSYFVLVDEKKGIYDSLKRSYHIVKGRWWKALGYVILIDIILILIMIVFSIPGLIVQGFLTAQVAQGALSVGVYIANIWVSEVFQILGMFIVFPLALLFIKNMYQDWKKGKN